MCDIDEFKSPNILFLKGMYMTDCKDVGDIMGERLAEMIAAGPEQEQYTPKQTYDKIPEMFEDAKSWPSSTNLLCCECSCSFTWEPVFIPEAINFSGTRRGEYKPIKPLKIFCNFVCAHMFILSMFRESKWEKKELLKLLHKILTGQNILDIPIGPHRTEMVQYGGTMTVGEFKAKNKIGRAHV